MRVHLCVCLKQWFIVAEPLADQDGFVIMRGTSHRQLSIFYLKRGRKNGDLTRVQVYNGTNSLMQLICVAQK